MTGEEAFNEYRQAYENAAGKPLTPVGWSWSVLSANVQTAWMYIANRIDGFKGNEAAKPAKPATEFDQIADNLLNRATDQHRQMMYELLYASGCRIRRS